MNRSRVIMISSDVVGRRMAGPAIRAVELARILGRTEEVVLAAPNRAPVDGLEVISFRDKQFGRLVSSAKVIVTQGLGVPLRPILDPGPAVVLDFYDPNPVELLAHYRDKTWAEARLAQDHLRERLLVLAKRGDFFLYATERQRDFWLGLLAAAGRLTWEADQRHPNLDDLLQPVPFGLSDRPPQADRPVLKGVWPGIGPEDEVVIWNGGVWNWFDPLTVIKAVNRLKERRPHIRLFFLGISHPNPRIPEMAMVNRAVELANRLGLTDRHVFFNHGWVDYNLRDGYLLESDLAVLASGKDLETRLSFRTRVLDCLWAQIPVVLTEGDYFSDLTRAKGLGLVAPVGDDCSHGRGNGQASGRRRFSGRLSGQPGSGGPRADLGTGRRPSGPFLRPGPTTSRRPPLPALARDGYGRILF